MKIQLKIGCKTQTTKQKQEKMVKTKKCIAKFLAFITNMSSNKSDRGKAITAKSNPIFH